MSMTTVAFDWRRYVASGGTLTIPILVWNVACARYLPAPYSSSGFDRDVPFALLLSENLLRVAVIGLPFFMPLDLSTTAQRRRLALFVAGAVIYVASWVPLMVAPSAAWSTSLVGSLAPAYTPLIWLVGLGLLGGRRVGPWPLRRGVYLTLVAAFVTVHVAHAGVVYARIDESALRRDGPPVSKFVTEEAPSPASK